MTYEKPFERPGGHTTGIDVDSQQNESESSEQPPVAFLGAKSLFFLNDWF